MAGGHRAPGGRPGRDGDGRGSGPGLRAARPALAFPPWEAPPAALYLLVPGDGAAAAGAASQLQLRPGAQRHPQPAAALPGVGRGGTGAWVSMAIARRPGGAAMTRRGGLPSLRPAPPRPGGFPAPPAALRRPRHPPGARGCRRPAPPLP